MSIFRGEKLYISATYISEENQIGVIVDSLSLEGQRQQPGVTNRTLPLGGRDEQTEDNRNQLCWVAGLWCCRKSSIILTLRANLLAGGLENFVPFAPRL